MTGLVGVTGPVIFIKKGMINYSTVFPDSVMEGWLLGA